MWDHNSNAPLDPTLFHTFAHMFCVISRREDVIIAFNHNHQISIALIPPETFGFIHKNFAERKMLSIVSSGNSVASCQTDLNRFKIGRGGGEGDSRLEIKRRLSNTLRVVISMCRPEGNTLCVNRSARYGRVGDGGIAGGDYGLCDSNSSKTI